MSLPRAFEERKVKSYLTVGLSLLVLLGQPGWAADAGKDPSDAEFAKGDKLMGPGAGPAQVKQAVSFYTELTRKYPDSAKVHARYGASLAADAGLKADRKAAADEYETAVLEERQAIKLDPTYASPFCIIGQIYANQGKYEDAVAEFKKALAIKPNMYKAHEDLGIAYLDMDRLAESQQEFETCKRLHPEELLPHLNLGILLSKKGDLKGAIAEEEEALRLNPKSWTALRNLGNAYLDAGDFDNAKDKFQRAQSLAPGEPNSLSGLGWAKYKKGFKKEGLKDQEQAIKNFPPFVPAHTRRAVILAELGDKKGAEAEFQAAVKLNPKDLSAGLEYGHFLETNGRKDDAKSQYKRLLEVTKDYGPAKKALADLEQTK